MKDLCFLQLQFRVIQKNSISTQCIRISLKKKLDAPSYWRIFFLQKNVSKTFLIGLKGTTPVGLIPLRLKGNHWATNPNNIFCPNNIFFATNICSSGTTKLVVYCISICKFKISRKSAQKCHVLFEWPLSPIEKPDKYG